MFIVPVPGFYIDGFTDCAQHAERLQLFILQRITTKTHQAPNGGGRGIENIHAIFINDTPKSAGIRIGGDPFEHQGRGAGTQRTINGIAVTRNPAHIRRTEINIPWFILEDIDKGIGGIDHITRAGMDHPLAVFPWTRWYII